VKWLPFQVQIPTRTLNKLNISHHIHLWSIHNRSRTA